jgi:signal peptidase I
MPQGGLDWELIAMVAAGAAALVIVWDWIAARGGAERSETRKGILEVAWPVLFIACMGLLLKFTDFAAVLLLAAVITGLIWLFDARWARLRRTSDAAEPVVVDMARAFFPVIVVVFLIRSFWVEPFKIPSGSMKPTLLGGRLHPGEQVHLRHTPSGAEQEGDRGEPDQARRRGRVPLSRRTRASTTSSASSALPGDQVIYRAKRLTVNGQDIPMQPAGFYTDAELNYLRLPTFAEKLGDHAHQMMIVPTQPPVDLAQVRQFAHRGNCEYNDDGFSCTVPAGHYFMMGDNRDQSSDSRYWGFVPDDHVKGRAFLVWMNFGDFKRIGNGIE